MPPNVMICIKMRKWSRNERIGAAALIVAVITLVGSFVVPEVRRDLSLGKAPIDQPPPPVSAEPTNPKVLEEPIVAQTAKDASELRQQNRVERLKDTESGKTISEIPPGSFGFAMGIEFVVRPVGEIELDPVGLRDEFEVQKLADRTTLLVGYVGPETLENLREGLVSGRSLTLYADAWKEASNLVAVPAGRLKFIRTRLVEIQEENGKRLSFTNALDCQAH